MVDHHVDRPGVDERQRLKLTGTNRPIGLIIPIRQCSPRKARVNIGLSLRRSRRPFTEWPSALARIAKQSDDLSVYGHQACCRRKENVLIPSNGLPAEAFQNSATERPTSLAPRSPTGRRAFWPAPAETVCPWQTGVSSWARSDQPLNLPFADLVVLAERLHPIPFRTRP